MALQVAKASTAALAPWEEGGSKVEGGGYGNQRTLRWTEGEQYRLKVTKDDGAKGYRLTFT